MTQRNQGADWAESWAFKNGEWKSLRETTWSMTDLGPMQGAVLVERLRTFDGKVFEVDRHLDRLHCGAEQLGIPSRNEPIASWIEQLVEWNQPWLEHQGDLGIVLLLSPGDPSQSISGDLNGRGNSKHTTPKPTWILHAGPIPWSRLRGWYAHGTRLALSQVENVSERVWAPSIKSRSRLQYYLADREVGTSEPGSIAVLLNHRGFITETSVANLIVVDADGKLKAPAQSDVLWGVSLETTDRIAKGLGWEIEYGDLVPSDLDAASEILLTGTMGSLWHASSWNGRLVGDGQLGPKGRRLLQGWIELAGIDFVEQAMQRASVP